MVQILGRSGAKAAKAKATKVEIVQIQHETMKHFGFVTLVMEHLHIQHRDLQILQGSRKTVNKLLESDPLTTIFLGALSIASITSLPVAKSFEI